MSITHTDRHSLTSNVQAIFFPSAHEFCQLTVKSGETTMLVVSFYLLVVCLAGLAFGQQCPQGQLFADTNDQTCKRYYECYNNQYYTNNCPDGQIFYPGLNQCVLQSSYDCVCNSPCVRPNCNGNENTDIADTTSCNNYIYCNGRYPLRRPCPQDNLFNPDRRSCEPRSTTTYKCLSDPYQCPQPTGTFADLRDPNCQIYYNCNNWQPGPRQICESNFRYYEKINRCVLPDSYDCQEQNKFVCPGRDQDYPDPKDRTRYYYCMGDAPLRRSCPSGQYFDANNRRCQ